MNLPEVPTLHEVRRLELTYRLLFFLRDLGIKSAFQPSIDAWTDYMHVTGQLILSDMPDSQ